MGQENTDEVVTEVVEDETEIEVEPEAPSPDLAVDIRPTELHLTTEQLDKVPYHRGPYTAKIVMVGEAPGADEEADEHHRPFVGASGRELMRIIREQGLKESDIYFTNVLKQRPNSKNDFDLFVRENPKQYAIHCKILAAELALLKDANVFVPVGAEALTVLTGRRSIESWRGSIIPATLPTIKGKKCVSIIHPAAMLRQWLYRPSLVLDIARIKQEALIPDITLPQRIYNIRPSYTQVVTELTRLIHSPRLVSIDIESLPGQGKIVMVQVCDDPYNAMSILLQRRDGTSVWPIEQELVIWKLLAQLFETPRTLLDGTTAPRLIGQNFSTFDTYFLGVHGVRWELMARNIHLDTMEGFGCLQPQLSKGLDFLTSIYTREPYYKSEGKEWSSKQGEEEFLTYGCKDVCVVHEIAPQIEQELREEGLWEFYQKRFVKMAHRRLGMTSKGLLVSLKTRKELDLSFSKEIIKTQCKLNILVGKKLNVKSFPQMRDLLYQEMKLPHQYANGRLTTGEDALLALSARHPSKVFEHVLALRSLRTLHSGNIKCRLDSDNHIRSSFGFAETGRCRSFGTPLGTGGNLQNWQHLMRSMIIPEPGMRFVEADLSQAEARVVAWRARDEQMIEMFLAGKDIHRRTAKIVFQLLCEEHEISKKAPERDTAKRIAHASNYAMKAFRFAQVYNKWAAEMGRPFITEKTAYLYLERYHTQVAPKIRSVYHKEIAAIIDASKTLFNPFGRRMIFHDRLGDELYKAGFAFYAQSTIGDLTNIILDAVFDILDVRLQVHDSILAQCGPTDADVAFVVKTLYDASQIPIEIEGRELIVPIEFKTGRVGDSWMDLRDYKYEPEHLIAA